MDIIAFFNNKGGVGKTSLAYHLAWMYGDLGHTVLAVDLDPQANLSSAFLDDARLEELWPEEGSHPLTIHGAIEPIQRGLGDIVERPHVETIDDRVHLLVGDLLLAGLEDLLSSAWPAAMDRHERAFRTLSAFGRIIRRGARAVAADLVLVDLGPNLGAINRASLVACDHVVVPLAADLFSLQGLRNLGPTLTSWRNGWKERVARAPRSDLDLPPGGMRPRGYVVMQHAARMNRPVRAYERWVARIPCVYAEHVAGVELVPGIGFDTDPHCLGLVKHYHSLVALAQEARKPIFHLRTADGAIGAHLSSVEDARKEFRKLAQRVLEACAARPAPAN